MGVVRQWEVANSRVWEFAAASELELLEAILSWYRLRADNWTLHSISTEPRRDEDGYTYIATVLCSTR